ncbi:MAG: multicopper oxidase domain-containing protein, partial [Planctomycetes bacterium]|nr:multicopper oxidase domain-containing protein [Planctomycetota bacterium]
MLALLTLAVAPATLIAQSQEGRVVTYDLITQERDVSPAGTSVKGLVVNGSSPAPVLRFKEGDIARIRVRNGLKNENTSIHWHGLLVPIAMDGVPYLTTPHIPPGGEHIFEFPLRQSGTYWYHSHTGLQEQRGVYGAIVIEPREPQGSFDREHVVVLSDWTNEDPVSVMRTLMMGREWYGIQKNTAQSLFGAWKEGAWSDYWEREKSRVHPMDLSDVAYDAFLANGKQDIQLDAEPGERVLVRFVNAGASTYFHLSSGFGPFTIVASDGQLVDPVEVRRLLMGMGETYDVLITMPETGEGVEVLATAHDRTGSSSIRLGSGKPKGALPPPKPDLYGWDEMASAGMESINPERGMRAATAERPFAPYALLRSPNSTVIPEANDEFSVRTITMRLTRDMTRYVWGFDGKTLSEESVIPVKENEVLRIKLINDTMMHHPIHLHGHFFRLLNGHGDHAPLKHTVDVPPMGTRVIERIANEEKGDWFFHCHMLYHMDAGMARVFSYLDQEP